MKNLTIKTKALYGLGFASQGIKDGLFQLFLFFYFSQILGLDAALTGASTLIALAFDAISDPLVGMMSDNWKSKKWGRRHPFMMASAVPLGLSIWLLFLPPANMSQPKLFCWMTGFTILVRLSLTLFIIPAMSLGAELSDDYEERTSVTSYRIAFGATITPLLIIFGLLTFFVPTEGMSNGLFNKAAYPQFAFLSGVLIVTSILISTWGTRDTIPSLPQAEVDAPNVSPSLLAKSFLKAIKMRSYWSLVGYVMILYIGIGIGTTFATYFTTYFFGLSEKELAVLPVGSFTAGLLAFFVAPVMGKLLDKKSATLLSTLLAAFFFTLPFNLRLLDLFPNNGTTLLVAAYVVSLIFAYLFVFVALSLANSMMADVVDEYELISGERQEGLFFSTLSFAYKCTVGFGYLFAGVLLNWIAFPKQASLSEVPAEAIRGLGLVGGPILLCAYSVGVLFLLFYPITKKRYGEIRVALDA